MERDDRLFVPVRDRASVRLREQMVRWLTEIRRGLDYLL